MDMIFDVGSTHRTCSCSFEKGNEASESTVIVVGYLSLLATLNQPIIHHVNVISHHFKAMVDAS